MKYSKQNQLIYNLLKSRKDHPTADMLFISAREQEPDIGVATIYRNLKALSSEGKVATLETQDKRIHYDGDLTPHSHFICENCGKIVDVFNGENIPRELLESGCLVKNAKCVYYGLCSDCNKKEKN